MDNVSIVAEGLLPSPTMSMCGKMVGENIVAVCRRFPGVIAAHLYDLRNPSNGDRILIHAGGRPPEYFTLFVAVTIEPDCPIEDVARSLYQALAFCPERASTTYINFAEQSLSPADFAAYYRGEAEPDSDADEASAPPRSPLGADDRSARRESFPQMPPKEPAADIAAQTSRIRLRRLRPIGSEESSLEASAEREDISPSMTEASPSGIEQKPARPLVAPVPVSLPKLGRRAVDNQARSHADESQTARPDIENPTPEEVAQPAAWPRPTVEAGGKDTLDRLQPDEDSEDGVEETETPAQPERVGWFDQILNFFKNL